MFFWLNVRFRIIVESFLRIRVGSLGINLLKYFAISHLKTNLFENKRYSVLRKLSQFPTAITSLVGIRIIILLCYCSGE